MGVLTGIVQVAKEGIFSGLNNVITYNILGNDFETFFGLSEEEVENSLKYFELEYEIEDVKHPLWLERSQSQAAIQQM